MSEFVKIPAGTTIGDLTVVDVSAEHLLKPYTKHDTLSTELDTLRTNLVDLECQLISLLVTVQRAQGKEPSIMTRAERRRR